MRWFDVLGWILILVPSTRRIIKIRMGVFVTNWAKKRANVLLTTKNVLKVLFPFLIRSGQGHFFNVNKMLIFKTNMYLAIINQRFESKYCFEWKLSRNWSTQNLISRNLDPKISYHCSLQFACWWVMLIFDLNSPSDGEMIVQI